VLHAYHFLINNIIISTNFTTYSQFFELMNGILFSYRITVDITFINCTSTTIYEFKNHEIFCFIELFSNFLIDRPSKERPREGGLSPLTQNVGFFFLMIDVKKKMFG
jgi:hypothetical protein